MSQDQVGESPRIAGGEAAPEGSPASPMQTFPDRRRYLIVVARDQSDLWRSLRQTLAKSDGIEAILDRRHGGAWQWTQSRQYQDRGADRRRPSTSEVDLRTRAFLIVPRLAPEERASSAAIDRFILGGAREGVGTSSYRVGADADTQPNATRPRVE
jgi:hypothetical protein